MAPSGRARTAKTSAGAHLGALRDRGTPESGIVEGWEYQWLAAIPEASGSWVLPLEVGRRDLAAGTATTLAIRQLRAVQAARGADAPRPLLLLDSHYDVAELVHADLGVDILARLATNRRFYRAPGPVCGQRRAAQARPGLPLGRPDHPRHSPTAPRPRPTPPTAP